MEKKLAKRITSGKRYIPTRFRKLLCIKSALIAYWIANVKTMTTKVPRNHRKEK